MISNFLISITKSPPFPVSAAGKELDSIRDIFNEKEKELSVAMAKVDALTRQLDELKDGNIVNSYHISSAAAGNLNGLIGCQANSSKFNVELEKLKQELLVSGEIW